MDIVKGTYYLSFPQVLLGKLFKSGSWLLIDTQHMSLIRAPSLVAIAQLFLVINPAYSLNFLKGYLNDAKLVSRQMVNKTPCDLYNYSISIPRAAAQFPPATKRLMLQTQQILKITTLKINTCIDSQDRAVESSFSVNLNNVSYPVPGAPLLTEHISGTMDVTLKFSQVLSKHFYTAAPKQSDIINLEALLTKFGL